MAQHGNGAFHVSNATRSFRDLHTTDLGVSGAFIPSVQSVAVPAPAAAAAESRILPSSTFVTLLPATNVNDRAYLPSPTSVPDGKLFVIALQDTGCELSSEGDGTTATTINGTAVTDAAGDYVKELALAANTVYFVTKTGANAWTVSGGGAPDA